jgi:aryl-alcohol dehydrogenase-like predicted oxidoreductase
MNQIAATDLNVFPLCLGGNVFGWTADERESFAVLDAYAEAGGNFIDTADTYSAWAPGNEGGESERIIGRWMAERGNRDAMVVATKVGNRDGLSAHEVHRQAEASLRNLRTDRIDLYYAHSDDPDTPLAETFGAFDALIGEGAVRYAGVSNYSADRVREVLDFYEYETYARPVAIQPHYNLLERDRYEASGLAEASAEGGLACLPYFGLAKGFLTGKYRVQRDTPDSRRRGVADAYRDRRAERVLDALESVAEGHGVSVAAVALAWLLAQPTVVAPIASARTPEQLAGLLPMAGLRLSDDELRRLTDASASTVPTP